MDTISFQQQQQLQLQRQQLQRQQQQLQLQRQQQQQQQQKQQQQQCRGTNNDENNRNYTSRNGVPTTSSGTKQAHHPPPYHIHSSNSSITSVNSVRTANNTTSNTNNNQSNTNNHNHSNNQSNNNNNSHNANNAKSCNTNNTNTISEPNLSGLFDYTAEGSWRKPGKHFRARLLLKDGNNSFKLNKECSIERYYQVANKVLDQFLQHPIDSREEIVEAYLIGSRLSNFLSSVLPTHPEYFSRESCLLQMRDASQKQLVELLQYIEQISIMIDQEEHQSYIRRVLNGKDSQHQTQQQQPTQLASSQSMILNGADSFFIDVPPQVPHTLSLQSLSYSQREMAQQQQQAARQQQERKQKQNGPPLSSAASIATSHSSTSSNTRRSLAEEMHRKYSRPEGEARSEPQLQQQRQIRDHPWVASRTLSQDALDTINNCVENNHPKETDAAAEMGRSNNSTLQLSMSCHLVDSSDYEKSYMTAATEDAAADDYDYTLQLNRDHRLESLPEADNLDNNSVPWEKPNSSSISISSSSFVRVNNSGTMSRGTTSSSTPLLTHVSRQKEREANGLIHQEKNESEFDPFTSSFDNANDSVGKKYVRNEVEGQRQVHNPTDAKQRHVDHDRNIIYEDSGHSRSEREQMSRSNPGRNMAQSFQSAQKREERQTSVSPTHSQPSSHTRVTPDLGEQRQRAAAHIPCHHTQGRRDPELSVERERHVAHQYRKQAEDSRREHTSAHSDNSSRARTRTSQQQEQRPSTRNTLGHPQSNSNIEQIYRSLEHSHSEGNNSEKSSGKYQQPTRREHSTPRYSHQPTSSKLAPSPRDSSNRSRKEGNYSYADSSVDEKKEQRSAGTVVTTPSSNDLDDCKGFEMYTSEDMKPADEEFLGQMLIETRLRLAQEQDRIRTTYEESSTAPSVTRLETMQRYPFAQQENEYIYKANGSAYHLSRSAQRRLQFDDEAQDLAMANDFMKNQQKYRPLQNFKNCVRCLLPVD